MKILLCALGCDKNLVDSEKMLSLLSKAGYELTDNEGEAQAVIVNTCCFIGDAKEESVNALLHYAEKKQEGSLAYLVAAGCLAQRYSDQITRQIPEVDAILGTMAPEQIVQTLEALQEKKALSAADKNAESPLRCLPPLDKRPYAGSGRILSSPGHYAYLKIAEGCNKNCSYCIIPKVRGPYRSIPEESLIKEAGELAASGVKELILVAQETTLYGIDLYGKKSLAGLLQKLSKIPQLRWIRLLYCYPEEIDEPLINALQELPKVLPYLDIPIQHGNDEILKRMGRRTDQAAIRETVAKLRAKIPDICLRTTLITGFPGETEEAHQECLAFIKETAFDRLGVFEYSKEEGTAAAKMPSQIHWKRKKRWKEELLSLQQAITFERNKAFEGRSLEVLVEGGLAEENGIYVGRSYRDAPEVDGLVFIRSERELITGNFVSVSIDSAKDYDLIGDFQHFIEV
ncbi:MAG: 30S ribosomal protein S12 methylthiotransferase RimO [Lachnospiraceae bacterium]|nr:30S ribosomal protein S12 methylthiotransferase RimO [Lachnospiraceae bacterium]